MSLRINQNVNARKTHRYLQQNNEQLSKSLEKLSSGFKINRAADGPASLVISEQMRAQIAGLDQAIANAETGVSMVQTTENALNEVNRLLISMRQLAIHAANEGVNDQTMVEADQAELENALASIDRISTNTQFGKKKLLDGSNAVNGSATGEGLEYVNASTVTKASSGEGYEVKILQDATKSYVVGKTKLTDEMVKNGETFKILEGGKAVSYSASKQDTVETAVQNFRAKVKKAGLNVDIEINGQGYISINHKEYGSDPKFSVSSTTDGVLSSNGGEFEDATRGKDIAGTIAGESATGKGQILTGIRGANNTDSLSIRYSGNTGGARNKNGDLIGSQGGVLLYNDQNQVIERTKDNGDVIVGEVLENNEVYVNGRKAPYTKEDIIDESNYSAPDDELLEKDETGVSVGRVVVTQNSLNFQIGANPDQTVGVSLLNTATDALAKGVRNETGFKSLADIDLRTTQGALDTLRLIDASIDDITSSRAALGAFQKNTLESSLVNLRVATENMVASESVIRDADMAEELAEFTRNKIMFESATSMLQQANDIPQSIIRLIT